MSWPKWSEIGDCNIQVGYFHQLNTAKWQHRERIRHGLNFYNKPSIFAVALVIFGEEQRGAAGACQKCSIENVNKQIGGKIPLLGEKSLYLMCLVGGEVTE